MTLRAFIRPALLAALLLAWGSTAWGIERFPPPEIEDPTYSMPEMIPSVTEPQPEGSAVNWVDVGVLVAAMGVAAWIALRSRNRRAMVVLAIFSLLYFGFYRSGCICPIGSIHHVTKSLADTSYPLPFTVALFFVLPLAFALLFGRVFCAGVCPLGAIQDLVLIKPVKVPMWLEHVLWMVPFIYLGSAVLFTVTDTAFIICRYDPFVGFFRLVGPARGDSASDFVGGVNFVGPGAVMILGGLLLLIGAFVGRPYCRYLCPYRVLLSAGSRFAWRKPSITPDECVVCSLCEDACPFNAIEPPTPEGVEEE